jgi:hypothetical protein
MVEGTGADSSLPRWVRRFLVARIVLLVAFTCVITAALFRPSTSLLERAVYLVVALMMFRLTVKAARLRKRVLAQSDGDQDPAP